MTFKPQLTGRQLCPEPQVAPFSLRPFSIISGRDLCTLRHRKRECKQRTQHRKREYKQGGLRYLRGLSEKEVIVKNKEIYFISDLMLMKIDGRRRPRAYGNIF